MKKIIKCDYCKKPTLATDITYWKKENLHLCVFCLKNKKRPIDYLSKKEIINKNIDEPEEYSLYNSENKIEDFNISQSIDEENEDLNRQIYDDTLERDALEFSDPDDFYRNDDYDNETLWYDKEDEYDDGWRR